ncbi:hypothetical protein M8994_16105 [Brucella sp. 21LCYQ03]|nr:hypothetical protein [Brucella sp. 21LCYQ03]
MFSVHTADVFWSIIKSFKDVEEIERGTDETLAEGVDACKKDASIVLFNITPEELMDSIKPEFEDNQPLSGYRHFAISVIACTIAVIQSVIFGFVIGQPLGWHGASSSSVSRELYPLF